MAAYLVGSVNDKTAPLSVLVKLKFVPLMPLPRRSLTFVTFVEASLSLVIPSQILILPLFSSTTMTPVLDGCTT